MGAKLCVIMKEESSSDEGEVNGHDCHEAWVSRHSGGHQVEGTSQRPHWTGGGRWLSPATVSELRRLFTFFLVKSRLSSIFKFLQGDRQNLADGFNLRCYDY